jgi:hypothetical protein
MFCNFSDHSHKTSKYAKLLEKSIPKIILHKYIFFQTLLESLLPDLSIKKVLAQLAKCHE